MRFTYLTAVSGLLLTVFTFRAYAQETVTRVSPDPLHETWRIDRPDVKLAAQSNQTPPRIKDYPQIKFWPEDKVIIRAGGCVQTGGSGRTWKRYVDPSGDNSVRLYHGLVRVPGVMSTPRRIQSVNNQTLNVPPNTTQPPADLHLQLGYEDDNYEDNGYDDPDSGTEDQCLNAATGTFLGNAFVEVSIEHKAQPPVTDAPLNLVTDKFDPNGYPFNPKLRWQVDHPGGKDPNVFDLCNYGPIGPPCSTQVLDIDETHFTDVAGPFTSPLCPSPSLSVSTADKTRGHFNYLPVTYSGLIFWKSHSSPAYGDDDYSLDLATDEHAGVTAGNDGRQIECEFNSDETIDSFTTPLWRQLHDAVDRSDQAAHRLLDGSEATVTGLYGFDTVHGYASELHPVFSLAIHRDKGDPVDDPWMVFVRSWGDEGMCSEKEHQLVLLSPSYTIRLPWRAGATGVSINNLTVFKMGQSTAVNPMLTFTPGDAKDPKAGVFLTFTPFDTVTRPVIHGDLHLTWLFSPGARPANPERGLKAAATTFRLRPGSDESNEAFERLRKVMTPQQRRLFVSRARRARVKKHTTVLPAIPPPAFVSTFPYPPGFPNSRPGVRTLPNQAKIDYENRRIQALREIFNGARRSLGSRPK